MSRPEFTHAITLAPNRENISADLLRRIFGRFCMEVDQFMIGVGEVRNRYSSERLQMIAMPEKLGINPHLHCVANFSRMFWQHRLDKPWETELLRIWKCCTYGAGEIFIGPNKGTGPAFYATKEAFRRGHDFFHSWDFHPDARLVDHRLMATRKLLA